MQVGFRLQCQAKATGGHKDLALVPTAPGSVEGFAVDAKGAAAPAWAVAFPPQEDRILALAAPDAQSPVYSYAKARARAPAPHPPHPLPIRSRSLLDRAARMRVKLRAPAARGRAAAPELQLVRRGLAGWEASYEAASLAHGVLQRVSPPCYLGSLPVCPL
jgi:hypothetical protein